MLARARRFGRRPLALAWAAAALLALVATGSARAAVFEFEATAVSGVDAGSIATDSAGRLYVPVRNSGRIYVYDSARGGNKSLGFFGSGILVDPVAVAVDNRLNIYVADAGRNAIVFFGPFISGAGYNGADGSQGSALGQISGPSSIAADPEPRIYVAERGNQRVQAFDPARGQLGHLFAFGVADPAPFGPPDAVAIDRLNRFYVGTGTPGSGVRFYDARGGFMGTAVGGGQVNGAAGVTVDPFGRLIVSDVGNDRLTLFGSEAFAFGLFGTFGSSGSGAGQFNAPAGSALAPGAMLYVNDSLNSRIVRLRFDDSDHDGAIDAGDTCPGLANQDQLDHDGDGAGNACDADDDGDGIADASDPCPLTKPVADANRDGCADPVATATSPRPGRNVAARGRGTGSVVRVAGRARADTVGVAKVLVAVGRERAGSCAWWNARRKSFERGSCSRPRYFRAKGARRWSLALPKSRLEPGFYSVRTRAIQRVTGLAERSAKPKTHFFVV